MEQVQKADFSPNPVFEQDETSRNAGERQIFHGDAFA
jgi:hypothetical protein